MKVNIIDNDLLSIQEARILAENAYEAHRKLAEFPQEKLDEIMECMAKEVSRHTRELAMKSCVYDRVFGAHCDKVGEFHRVFSAPESLQHYLQGTGYHDRSSRRMRPA